MIDTAALWSLVGHLFDSQKLAVLSTVQPEGHAYSSLVAFAATENAKTILFATTRATRKFENLMANDRVSLLVDNRSNDARDFREAAAATILGVAAEVSDERERRELVDLYVEKHPHLSEFVNTPTCALLKCRIEKIYLVQKFQKVMELHVDS